MANASYFSRASFMRELYATQTSRRREAFRILAEYRSATRTSFPPRKGVWSKFYEEKQGKYIHGKLTKYLQRKQISFCCYCREKIYHGKNSNIEHILPIKHYPMFAFEYHNLALACVTCNAIKSDNDFYRVVDLKLDYVNNSFDCFHPAVHDYNEHIDFLVFQSNYVYVRVFKFRTRFGERLCVEHLRKVSIYNVKEQANPVVSEAVKKLGEYLDGKPGYENASSALRRLATNI